MDQAKADDLTCEAETSLSRTCLQSTNEIRSIDHEEVTRAFPQKNAYTMAATVELCGGDRHRFSLLLVLLTSILAFWPFVVLPQVSLTDQLNNGCGPCCYSSSIYYSSLSFPALSTSPY